MASGVLIGKFLPPHRGHQYLIDFARRVADDLTVLVCTLPHDPIPGSLRFQWMRDHFGGVRVLHCSEELPQVPEDDPDHFWDIWREVVLSRMPAPPDYLFASEAYGIPFAQVLGAQFIPVDPLREMVPVSATLIRDDPMRCWDHLLPTARPYYLKRVVLVGPESAGKSTLTKWLARQFDTCFVAEYGRTFQENIGRDLTLEDMATIVRAHRASEDAMALQSRKILFIDTEAIVTRMWSQVFFNRTPALVNAYMADARYDHYLLLMPHPTEWHQDGWRVHPNFADRLRFAEEIRAHLERLQRPYTVLEGDWDTRNHNAYEAVEALLGSGGPSPISVGRLPRGGHEGHAGR